MDDLEDALISMKVLLERPGLAVLTANSASSALELLRDHDVALALLDVQMPRISGFELAEAMRDDPQMRDVPIIFLTGTMIDAGRTFRGYEAGAVDFLFKPVEPRVLESKVSVFVELHRQRCELRERNAELERLLRMNEKMAAELRHAHSTAVQKALTDELTGVPNRRHILQLAESVLADHRKQSKPVTIGIMDLDHFKRINDTHGHGAGDAVLRSFCRHCQEQLRAEHSLGRLGGEEFLLLMPATPVDDACLAVERLRRTLSPHEGVRFTFSAGLVQAQSGESLASVMERADQALYHAKSLGRDRVSTSPS
ncbi:diguanylate cyclase [Aquincola sp. S2]|uniref:diguanylate cyclase n=1 Tax=Pseudaquabacterium terrae TaxID=2732868 RepID=A0ABX2EPK0_9BURK|nr:diguanylate cyclase [Aquabacterium terrae]